jgi:hypothetical protein
MWSTEVIPILAPKRFGSAAIVSMVLAETLNRRSHFIECMYELRFASPRPTLMQRTA